MRAELGRHDRRLTSLHAIPFQAGRSRDAIANPAGADVTLGHAAFEKMQK
jgi:hypothetical protein